MDKKTLKRLCQQGTFELFIEVLKEVENGYSVEYVDNPYKLAYNHGEYDGVKKFSMEVQDLIKKYASEQI